jgi:hypothetical protein
VPVTKEQRTEQLQRDRAAALAAGRRLGGNAPYGWRHRRGELVPEPAEQAVRWLVLHLAGRGWSSRRIAEHLDELGIPTRSAGGSWHHATVQRIVTGQLADTG